MSMSNLSIRDFEVFCVTQTLIDSRVGRAGVRKYYMHYIFDLFDHKTYVPKMSNFVRNRPTRPQHGTWTLNR